MEIKIKNLQINEKAEITGFEKTERVYREKLLSMGLTRGTTIKLIKVAPLGDPVEIEVRGFKLSLRKKEAEILLLRKVQ